MIFPIENGDFHRVYQHNPRVLHQVSHFARRWTKTATITRLTPGRDYRAFVRAVSVVGNGALEI